MAKENENDVDARLTVRVNPEYLEALQKASLELGTNQSSIVRMAVQEYLERHEKFLSPTLFRFFRIWRQERRRMNML